MWATCDGVQYNQMVEKLSTMLHLLFHQRIGLLYDQILDDSSKCLMFENNRQREVTHISIFIPACISIKGVPCCVSTNPPQQPCMQTVCWLQIKCSNS